MTAKFEDLLELSGGFGRYQWFMYAFSMAVICVVAPQNAFMIFGKLEPAENEMCHFRNRSWYIARNASYETSCDEVRFYSVTMEFDLFGPQLWIQGLMISIQYVAMMLASLLVGQISDRFGRKPTFLGSLVAVVCLSIGASFSPNWQTFAAFRFLIGGFLVGVSCPLVVLCLETVPQNWRLFLNIGGWPFAYCFLALLGYFIQNWRYLLIATNLTAPIALIMVYWIHESPKWLIERGRFKEAVKIFQKIGNWNQVPNWNEDIFTQVELHLKETEQSRMDLKKQKAFLTYWHLFYDWNAATVLITIICTRTFAMAIYYGLLFNTGKLAGDVSLNLFLTMLIRCCVDLIPFLVSKHFQKVGRRHFLLLSMSITWLCLGYSALAYMTSLCEIVPLALNISAFVGISFVMITNNVVRNLCLVETTPTLLRSMGDSLVHSLSRFGAILGPQTILLFDIWKAGPSLVFLIELTFAAVMVYFVLPETKGKPLPDLPPKFTQKREDITVMPLLIEGPSSNNL